MHDSGDLDLGFKECLFDLLQQGHVDRRGDLPDEWRTDINCENHFNELKIKQHTHHC
jgi:hypothetical protein